MIWDEFWEEVKAAGIKDVFCLNQYAFDDGSNQSKGIKIQMNELSSIRTGKVKFEVIIVSLPTTVFDLVKEQLVMLAD